MKKWGVTALWTTRIRVAISGKKWDYQQIGGFRASDLEHSLERAALAYHDPKYAAAAKQIREGDDLTTVMLASN